MYHSISSMPRSTVMRGLHVPLNRFKFQMFLLKLFGYKGVSISQLEPYLNGKKGKVVGITFDDGYKNNLINAAPILKEYNFTATCYLVSNRIGSTNIWDISKGIPEIDLMDEFEIKKWIEMGMEIGAHTSSHADLNLLEDNEIRREIKDCKSSLESLFNVEINDFCYPYGHFNNEVVKFVKKTGFMTATTMLRGRANEKTNMLKLPRIPITHHTLPHLFVAKLFTSYEDKRGPY